MNTTERRVPAIIAAIATLILVPMPLGASPSPYSSKVQVEWTTGLIRAEVGLDLGVAGIRLPSGRSEAELQLGLAVPDLVKDAILEVGLDSYRSVGESIEDGTLDPSLFEDFLEAGKRTSSSLSRDLGRLEVSYEWRLADLASLYVRHSVPIDLTVPERYAPTRAYSGIVVYAQGEHSVRGEHLSGNLRACIFPRLYDSSMKAILERNLMDPVALRAWGAVAYAASLDDPVIESRAGGNPLRIIATEIFGSRRTDPVISIEDALRILGSPENRDLARHGKVVFVIDMP